MKSRFTEKEPWLKIPVEKLTWEDLPKDEAGKSAAICVLVLRSMPYAEYLQTEHWNEVRLVAIKRYLNQCLCGKDAKDAHHVNYDRKGFERPEDVIALCRECHTLWHETWTLQAKAGLEAE
jgi:5-methylcytosine-specific restriction endonuclease McrA